VALGVVWVCSDLNLNFRFQMDFCAEPYVRRPLPVNVHASGLLDYFGTLATTLDLLRQAIEERGYRAEDADLLRRITDDLLYLQANHAIHSQRAVTG